MKELFLIDKANVAEAREPDGKLLTDGSGFFVIKNQSKAGTDLC